MEWFIHQENINLYRRLLTESTDKAQRQIVQKLLAEELAKENEPLTYGLQPRQMMPRH